MFRVSRQSLIISLFLFSFRNTPVHPGDWTTGPTQRAGSIWPAPSWGKSLKQQQTCTAVLKTKNLSLLDFSTREEQHQDTTGCRHGEYTTFKIINCSLYVGMKKVVSCYSEKVSLEKAAIKRSPTECKLRSLLKNEPLKFRVDIHHGPMVRDELSSWASEQIHGPGFVIKKCVWYIPGQLEACCQATNARRMDNGVAFQEIERVLSCPTYQVILAGILMKLKWQVPSDDGEFTRREMHSQNLWLMLASFIPTSLLLRLRKKEQEIEITEPARRKPSRRKMEDGGNRPWGEQYLVSPCQISESEKSTSRMKKTQRNSMNNWTSWKMQVNKKCSI